MSQELRDQVISLENQLAKHYDLGYCRDQWKKELKEYVGLRGFPGKYFGTFLCRDPHVRQLADGARKKINSVAELRKFQSVRSVRLNRKICQVMTDYLVQNDQEFAEVKDKYSKTKTTLDMIAAYKDGNCNPNIIKRRIDSYNKIMIGSGNEDAIIDNPLSIEYSGDQSIGEIQDSIRKTLEPLGEYMERKVEHLRILID